ncbi:MAG: PEGA domain-containing protein [Myxococcota bacterium]
MRTRTYIALAFIMGIAAIGTVWFGINRATEAADDRAIAVDADFEPANLDEVDEPPEDTAETRTEPADEESSSEEPTEVRAEETSVEVVRPGQSRSDKKREHWHSAVLQIVTNFEKADVTVNGLPYPEYTPDGQEEGMVLPAGGPHIVEVTYDGKTKTYQVHLRARETRILMVELSGLQGSTGGARAKARSTQQKRPEPKKEEEDEGKESGRVTVYSKPNGTVLVDGSQTDEKTPGTVEVEPGRHDIQVKFDNGDVSEKKIIRVRKGSRIKLFFRQRD